MNCRQLVLSIALLWLVGSPQPSRASDQKDWDRYRAVLTLPTGSMEEFAEDFNILYTSDSDKAAALFYWIAINVDYDTRLLRNISSSGKKRSYSRQAIDRIHEDRIAYAWKKRKGVCENYARLYERLAGLVGLEAVMITGHARGDYLQAGSLGIGHAWNAVKIDGRWAILDATWGAGHLTAAMEFEKEFKPQFFRPDPIAFAYSHFPADPAWQLLDTPITEEIYLGRPAVGEAYLKLRISTINQDNYVIQAQRGKELVLSGSGEKLPAQFVCANLTARKQVPCSSSITEGEFVITLGADRVKNMKLGILNPAGEIILAYELRVR